MHSELDASITHLLFLPVKDIAGVPLDFNVTHFLSGREDASGFVRNYQLNLAFAHKVRGKLQFTGEFYGDTRLDQTVPGFISSLWALTYTITPRLIVDAGLENGLTSGGPHRHGFAGATYSIGEFYPGWRQRRKAPAFTMTKVLLSRPSVWSLRTAGDYRRVLTSSLSITPSLMWITR
jgi:hypothetical protein